jgi:hypothetical protein
MSIARIARAHSVVTTAAGERRGIGTRSIGRWAAEARKRFARIMRREARRACRESRLTGRDEP